MKIGFVSQKGGVGKSTLARAIAREYANAEWNVLIADLDNYQSTSFEWNSKRINNGFEPFISVQQFPNVEKILKVADNYDLVVFDGGASASRLTAQIGEVSDIVFLPTKSSEDDLNPQIRLAHNLVKNGVSKEKIFFVLCLTGDSSVEIEETIDYINEAGHKVIDGFIPFKRSYSLALDSGKTLTETSYKSLNQKADVVLESIVKTVDLLNK